MTLARTLAPVHRRLVLQAVIMAVGRASRYAFGAAVLLLTFDNLVTNVDANLATGLVTVVLIGVTLVEVMRHPVTPTMAARYADEALGADDLLLTALELDALARPARPRPASALGSRIKAEARHRLATSPVTLPPLALRTTDGWMLALLPAVLFTVYAGTRTPLMVPAGARGQAAAANTHVATRAPAMGIAAPAPLPGDTSAVATRVSVQAPVSTPEPDPTRGARRGPADAPRGAATGDGAGLASASDTDQPPRADAALGALPVTRVNVELQPGSAVHNGQNGTGADGRRVEHNPHAVHHLAAARLAGTLRPAVDQSAAMQQWLRRDNDQRTGTTRR